MADETVTDLQPLNERQEELVKQVKAGKVTEDLPDTESQLLTLARLGHLSLDADEDGYHFSVPKASRAKSKAASK